jgi:glyceraldehyde 3-phosphate dehydrogenase
MSYKIAINGLGRIGRAVLKQLVHHPQLEVVAANDLIDAKTLAYMLQYDTVYGRCEHKVSAQDGHLMIGPHKIVLTNEKDPSLLPWQEHNIDLVFECTGVFNTMHTLQKHLDAGAKRVILSAPAKDEEVPTIVFGVNKPDKNDRIVSCASCTTNCIAPVAEIMDRHLGVAKATMTTIHAYTATQALVDSPNKKLRRGRAAAMNFVPTTTGATKATTQVLTQLLGKFEGSAIRAPIPVGSISDINFVTRKKANKEEVNEIFRKEAETDRYRGILGVTDEPLVSSDIVMDDRASIVDLDMTMSIDGDLIKIMSWYDNEWGYSAQMVRTAEFMLVGK